MTENTVRKIAVSLSGAIVVGAGLLLGVAAKEVYDEPQVIHEAAQGSPSDQSMWNAFSSEGQLMNSTRRSMLMQRTQAPPQAIPHFEEMSSRSRHQ